MPSPLTYWLLTAMALAVIALSAPLLRRLDRSDAAIALAAGLAGLLVWLVWPVDRHEFVGHGGLAIRTLGGLDDRSDTTPWFVYPPGLRMAAEALRTVGGTHPRWLLVLSATSAAVWSGALGMAARRLADSLPAGLLVVVLLAADPQRLAWSHAAYHVMHPAALLAGAALLLVEAARSGGRASVLLSAAAGIAAAGAVSLRMESALHVLAIPGLLLMARQSRGAMRAMVVAGASGSAAGLALVATARSAGALGAAGVVGSEVPRALSSGLGFLEALAPWTSLGCLAALGIVGGAAWRTREADPWAGAPPVRAWLLLGLGLCVGWVGLAGFMDFGARHTVPMRGWLAVAVAVGAAPLLGARLGRWVALLPMLALLPGAAGSHRAYYADAASPLSAEELDQRLDIVGLSQQGCAFIANEGAYFPSWREGSHLMQLEAFDPLQMLAAWRQHDGCVLWLQDRDDSRWDETVRADRAPRLAHLWRWEPIGTVNATPPRGPWRVLRLTGRALDGWDGLPAPRSAIAASWMRFAPRSLGRGGFNETCVGAVRAVCRTMEACPPRDGQRRPTADRCRESLGTRCNTGAWNAERTPQQPQTHPLWPSCSELRPRSCGETGAAQLLLDCFNAF